MGVLVNAITDPVSGQPEFKQVPVRIEPYLAAWHGFVLSRMPMAMLADGYSTRIRGKTCWRHELAGEDEAEAWPQRLRRELGESGVWIELHDRARRCHRVALLREERLELVCFFEAEAHALPPRHWLETLFTHTRLGRAERAALLSGHPLAATPDQGTVVCACHGVGEHALRRAIAGGAASVEALGRALKAGTQCGSCVPELKALLAAMVSRA